MPRPSRKRNTRIGEQSAQRATAMLGSFEWTLHRVIRSVAILHHGSVTGRLFCMLGSIGGTARSVRIRLELLAPEQRGNLFSIAHDRRIRPRKSVI
jgi:hypothetical protein